MELGYGVAGKGRDLSHTWSRVMVFSVSRYLLVGRQVSESRVALVKRKKKIFVA